MPDISMCKNDTCKRRLRCYRYMATPTSKWQAYSTFCTDNSKGANCMYFSAIQASDEIRTIGRKHVRAKRKSSRNTRASTRTNK